MLHFLSRLQWLALIGFAGVFSNNEHVRLFFLFWLFSLLDIFSPLRSIFDSLKFLGQNLGMLLGILVVHLQFRFKLPSADTYTSEIKYSLPFDGKWFVVNGGIDRETSHSWALCSQRYAYDFFMLNEKGKSYTGEYKVLSSYLAYKQSVLAPADGVVVEVFDSYENTPIVGIGKADCKAPDVRGNHILIQHAPNEYSTIAHLYPGSICVKVGDTVVRGQQIAQCGNSGNTSEPHIHFQIQNKKSFAFSAGLPIRFQKILIDGAAEQEAYIVNGQFVENAE